MTKLILHIGTHKTGTTAIQQFCEANTVALAENGILYPLFDVRWPQRVFRSRNAFFLNRRALRTLGVEDAAPDTDQIKTCEREMRRLLKASDAPTVLLSDERMWYSGALHKGYWEAVRDAARKFGFEGIEIIVYLRRQDLFAESLWNQFVKATKKTETLQDYLNGGNIRAACDYYAGVKRLEAVFGKDAVRVAIYDRDKLKNHDVVDDFCYRIGLPLSGDYEQPVKSGGNERLNNNLVELKRIMNQSSEHQQLNNAFGPALAHAMLVDTWTPDTHMLTDEQRQKFLEPYKKGNKQLAKEYFSGSQLFAPAKESDLPQWQFDSQAMLYDAVLVLTDILATDERRIRMLEARVAKLESELSGGDRGRGK